MKRLVQKVRIAISLGAGSVKTPAYIQCFPYLCKYYTPCYKPLIFITILLLYYPAFIIASVIIISGFDYHLVCDITKGL
jgi:hypothetical protein